MKLKRPFNLAIRAQADGEFEISIRGVIGQYYDDATWSIKDTEEDVLNELKQIPEEKKINVRINSRGGDVGLGLGIYNALKRRAADITTYNDGYAMSAASLIMLAGSRRVSPPTSIWMIHRAQGGVDGTVDDMRTMADGMDVIDEMMANVYAKESGGKKSKEEFAAMMKKTTFFDGEKALELGLCTEASGDIEEDDEISNEEKQIIARYEKSIPENLRSRFTVKAQAPQTPPTTQQPTQKSMKKITAALVAAGFSVAADADENEVLTYISALVAERGNLKQENQKHIESRRNRVTALVETAIADKVVNESRKAGLIALGETNEQEVIAQISELRAALKPAAQRGAKPARATGENEDDAEQREARLEEIQTQMESPRCSPEQRAVLAREATKLRGNDTILAGLRSKSALQPVRN